MISSAQLQQLTKVMHADNNVNLAVVFGPAGPGTGISLLLDCEDSRISVIRTIVANICRRLKVGLQAFRLSEARPAAMLMRQILEEGTVVKDFYGQWDRLRDESDAILEEAEEHEERTRALLTAVTQVVEADSNVTLAAEFAPTRASIGDPEPPDMNLLLGCKDERKEPLLDLYGRLQGTGFRIEIMALSRALTFPYALSHIVRTGNALKDVDGQWARLQEERARIINAGIRQHATVQMAKQLYGGPDGTVSLN